MELKELIDLGVGEQITASHNREELATALKSVAEEGSAPHFTHYDIVRGGTGSIRLFLQQARAGAVEFPTENILPLSLAEELLGFARTEARYPDSPDPRREKGWIIRPVRIDGLPAAVAEAAWV